MKTQQKIHKRKHTTLLYGIILGVALTILSTTYAASPWFSGRTINGQTEPMSYVKSKSDVEMVEQFNAAAEAYNSASTTGLIDVVISIYTNWAGDNDGNKQGGAGNAEQDTIEKIVHYFANGVYEMTDGSHKLRNVYIFQDGLSASHADIVWTRIGGPHVPYKGGIGTSGGHVNMFDIFKNGSRNAAGVYSDKDLLADQEGAGYTLAHEWGHYFFGVYDEYKIQNTDVTVNPAIMNSQWNARGGDYKWLNFSIAYQAANPNGPYVNTRMTAQHRSFAKSCWETIASNTTGDSTNLTLGVRIYYPEVGAVAPVGTNTPAINLPSAQATNMLNIMWMSSNVLIQIVIDKSGSMSGTIGAAKTAARMLVDLVKVNNYVGVIAYSSGATTLVPITKIEGTNTRTTIKAAISTLTASGSTAIGTAAQAALNGILASSVSNVTRAVFLLTDGHSNTGVDPLSVIPAYQNAKVPIIGFGYGSSVDPKLPQMALSTGGKYYSSPTTLPSIASAFQDAKSYVSSAPTVASNKTNVKGKEGKSKRVKAKFPIDSTLSSFNLVIACTGTTDVSTFQLRGPKKQIVPPTNIESDGAEKLIHFSVNNAKAGIWKIKGKVESNSEFAYQVGGTQNETTYSLDAFSAGGFTVTSPAPIMITAMLRKDLSIKKARINAVITEPGGSKWYVKKLQNSEGGIYTAPFSMYTGNGSYEVEVHATSRGGKYTYDGSSLSLPENSDIQPKIRDSRVRENFTRTARFNVNVVNVGYTPNNAITGKPTFKWPIRTDAKGYKLEVEDASDNIVMKKSISKKKGSYTHKKSLPGGSYRWRIGTKVHVPKPPKSSKEAKATETIWSSWVYFTQT